VQIREVADLAVADPIAQAVAISEGE